MDQKAQRIDLLFTPVLLKTSGVAELLKKHNVDPRQYVLFMYARQRKKGRKVGMVITLVLTVLFFMLGQGSFDGSSSQVRFFAGAVTALLGFGIGYGSMRFMEGWRIPYTNNPDNQSRGFEYVGLLNTFSTKYMRGLTQALWEEIADSQLSAQDPLFLVPGPEAAIEIKMSKAMKMTPEKERVVAVLVKIQRICAWSALVVVLMFFTDGLFFGFLAWSFGALWMILEGMVGWIKRYVSGWGTTETVEIYGWPARFAAATFVFTGILFLFGGVLGMLGDFGIVS